MGAVKLYVKRTVWVELPDGSRRSKSFAIRYGKFQDCETKIDAEKKMEIEEEKWLSMQSGYVKNGVEAPKIKGAIRYNPYESADIREAARKREIDNNFSSATGIAVKDSL